MAPGVVLAVVVVGSVVLLALLLLAARGGLGATRAGRRRLLRHAPGGWSVVAADGRATRADGTLAARLEGALVLTGDGERIGEVTLDRTHVTVTDATGRPWGSGARDVATTRWVFHDTAGRELASLDLDPGRLLTARPFEVIGPYGHRLGRLAMSGLDTVVVQLEPPAPDPLRTLLLALAVAMTDHRAAPGAD